MSNVRLLFLLQVLRGLRFGLAVYVLYCLRLTDYAGIGVVETVSIATAIAMEIPTGIVADRWGRRRSLAASFAVEVAGYLLLAAASGLGGLVLSLFVIQIGRALHSGTFEAMLWETLEEAGLATEYVRVLGRANALGLASFAAACLCGGFLYAISPRLPYLAAATAFAVAALAALALREPGPAPRGRVPTPGSTREPGATGLAATAPALPSPAPTVATHAAVPRSRWRQALAVLRREWRLAVPLTLVGLFLSVAEELLDETLVVEFGFPSQGLGLLFAAAYLGAAAATGVSHRLEHALGRRTLLFTMAIAGAVTLAASPLLGRLGGGLTFLLRHAMRSIHDTVSAGQLAATADASLRATLLSTANAARSLPYVALAWPMGVAMDAATARGFALWFGAAMVVATAVAWRLSFPRRGPIAPAPGTAGTAAAGRGTIGDGSDRW